MTSFTEYGWQVNFTKEQDQRDEEILASSCIGFTVKKDDSKIICHPQKQPRYLSAAENLTSKRDSFGLGD
jgi:hypothetical protein